MSLKFIIFKLLNKKVSYKQWKKVIFGVIILDVFTWNRKEVTIRTETTEETTTGIALIPSMGGDSDLDLMLQQQQSDALLLAKTKTNELS